jgi:hypothetical protein
MAQRILDAVWIGFYLTSITIAEAIVVPNWR